MAQSAGLAVEERTTQVIDPPSFGLMAEMINVISRKMGQSNGLSAHSKSIVCYSFQEAPLGLGAEFFGAVWCCWPVAARPMTPQRGPLCLSRPRSRFTSWPPAARGGMSLMGVVASVAGKSEALTVADIRRDAINGFVEGYKLPGDGSSYLRVQFIAQQGREVNAFINGESWLLSLNQLGKLRETLTRVYPHEGVAGADDPLMLLEDTRRDEYLKVVADLKGHAAQTWRAKTTDGLDA